MDALALLSGDAQSFFEKVWASHIHVHHADPAELVALLSLDDVDHLLTSTALRAPALRIAKDGSVLPSSSFTRGATLAGQPLTGLVDARKVLDLYDDGATVVLQGLHRYWPPLTELVRSLELSLGHPCQTNAYLTPPGSQGFALHSDSHDVFVFSTHGRKQWEIHDDGGAREVMLEPGVSMYLPTGTPHAARTQDTASLHVTLGINVLEWRGLLRQITAEVLESTAYDGRLPGGYLDESADLTIGITELLRQLVDDLSELDADALTGDAVGRFLTERTPVLRGGLDDRVALARLADDTGLVRRPSATCVLVPEADKLRVLLGDRELTVPRRLLEPIRFVRDHDTFAVADLAPWLDAGSRLVLVRRLVREGLLRIDA